MELECAKYHEKMDFQHAACRHPGEYCNYRISCLIHFIGRENRLDAVDVPVQDDNKDKEKVKE